jgi:S1-C subfamily serine protease
MIKINLSILLVILVITSIALPCFAANTARDAANSVVMVYTEHKAVEGGIEKDVSGWGTGFAIGKVDQNVQYIVTNYHVIKDAYENSGTIKVYFSVAANKFVQAEVYWKNELKDLAILKLPEPTTERKALVLRMSKNLNIDDTYSALGYPYTETMVNELPKFDMSDITITRGNISKTTRVSETDLYLLDLKIDHGNSGGPLVNSKGEVVGINTFGVTKEGNTPAYYAIVIDELVKNIDRSVIPVTLYGEISTTMLIIIIVGAIAVILIIAIIIMLIKKNKKKSIKNSGVSNAAPIAVSRNVVQGNPVSASVIGITGTFAGQRFELKNKLVFGRDNKKCNVIFPLDIPGISAVHCMVTSDANGVALTDLGSSYGTFLANGTKLVANQKMKLNSGDTFYLSSEDCKFEFVIYTLTV